jgi:HAD superfamily phosphoserine phosphatase-like hydrolase
VKDLAPPYDTVVLDCDSTLSAIEGIDELAGHLRDELRVLTERAMAGEIALEAVYGLRLERVRPSRDDVERVARRYVETLVPGMRDLVARLVRLGKRVLVVSGGLRPAVRHVAQALGLPDTHVHAVDVRFDAQGRYVDFERTSPLARSGGKPALLADLRSHADLGRVAFVGDGATDLETAPHVARFVAFGAVVRRPAVFERAAAHAMSVHELARTLLTPDELERSDEPMQRLWIPGPTHVRAEVLAAQALPMIGHRAPQMDALIERIDPHLAHLFGFAPGSGTRGAVATGSATALMESALHGVGPRVLCVVNGAFAKRWHEVARTLGREARAFDVPWGEAPDLERLCETLVREGPFDALTVVANETSTGVLTPLAPLAAALRERAPETLLLVDAVTLAGGQAIAMDALGIDFVLTGSQKALALPPGLALCAASQRYQERARKVASRSWYLDPLRIIDGHTKRATPTTPAISLYQALALQLDDIAAGRLEGGARDAADGWARRFERHTRMQERMLRWAHEHDLCAFPARSEWCSPTVSCIASGTLDVARLCAELEEAGHHVSNGYGDLKGKTFRVGHFGDHTEADLATLLDLASRAVARQRR